MAKPDLMTRTRAAVTYVNTSRLGSDDPTALVAFMALFHPEVPDDQVRQMAMAKRADNQEKKL